MRTAPSPEGTAGRDAPVPRDKILGVGAVECARVNDEGAKPRKNEGKESPAYANIIKHMRAETPRDSANSCL